MTNLLNCQDNNIPDLPNEIWATIAGCEGKYLVSNFGRVKSLDRWIFKEVVGKQVLFKGKILKQSLISDGYQSVTLYTNTKKKKPTSVHLIVFFSFNWLDDKKEGYEVDHIDNNKLNNHLDNLQYIPCRRNSAKRSLNLKKTSQFTGVSWTGERNKWQVHVRINSKSKYLGRFDDEYEAHLTYLKAVNDLKLNHV